MDLTELQIVELDMFLAFPDREDAINLARFKQLTTSCEMETRFYAYVVSCLQGKKLMREVYKCA